MWQPTLTDGFVRLRPLLETDFEALYALASDPAVWEQHPNPNRYERAVFQQYFQEALLGKMAFVMEEVASGEAIGCTRYYHLSPETQSIYIGYTFIGKAYWGGKYNAPIKKLMLDYAFRYVESVFLEAGINNFRSKRAIEKIGGQWIDDFQKPDGSWGTVFVVMKHPPKNNYLFRWATEADLPRIEATYEEARNWQRSRQVVVWPLFSTDMLRQDVQERRLYKIMQGDIAACFFTLTFNDPAIWQEHDADPAIYIHRIATHPELRGPNYVKILTQWVANLAITRSKRYVRLDTIGHNIRLIQHYQEAGFQFLGMQNLPDVSTLPPHYALDACCLFELDTFALNDTKAKLND